jgi:hypothetical protein
VCPVFCLVNFCILWFGEAAVACACRRSGHGNDVSGVQRLRAPVDGSGCSSPQTLLEKATDCIEQQVVGADSHFDIHKRGDFGDWALAARPVAPERRFPRGDNERVDLLPPWEHTSRQCG